MSVKYAFKDVVGKKVLITGDVGVGKTKLKILIHKANGVNPHVCGEDYLSNY